MNDLSQLYYDTPRGVVVTPRGEVKVKEHNGWKYINYQGQKIGVSKIATSRPEEDPVFNYIFGGGFMRHPCPAMQYWIVRHRLKQPITPAQFKIKYSHLFSK